MTASNSECRWIMKYYIALLAHSIGTNPRLMYKYAALPVFPHLPRPPPPPAIPEPGFLLSSTRFHNVFPLPLAFSEKYLLSYNIRRPHGCLLSTAFGLGLFCRNHPFFIWACFIVLFLVSLAESLVHAVITVSQQTQFSLQVSSEAPLAAMHRFS